MSSVQMSNWELARLLSTGEGMRYPLKNGLNTLGGRSRNDISFVSAYCSNGHCNIRVEASGVSLDDHSRNGTFVNTQKFENETVGVIHGDKIGLGIPVACQYSAHFDNSAIVLALRNLNENENFNDENNEVITIHSSDSEASDTEPEDNNDSDNQPIRRTSTMRRARRLTDETDDSGVVVSPSQYGVKPCKVVLARIDHTQNEETPNNISGYDSDSDDSMKLIKLVRKNELKRKQKALANQSHKKRKAQNDTPQSPGQDDDIAAPSTSRMDAPIVVPRKIRHDLLPPASPDLSPETQDPVQKSTFESLGLMPKSAKIEPFVHMNALRSMKTTIAQWNPANTPDIISASRGVEMSVRNQILLKIRTYAYNALLNKDESTERQAKIKYLPNVPCSIQQGNVYECKVNDKQFRFGNNDLLVVNINQRKQFFAIISGKPLADNNGLTFIIESSNRITPQHGPVKIRTLSNIDSELNAFFGLFITRELPIYNIIENPARYQSSSFAPQNLREFKTLSVAQRKAFNDIYAGYKIHPCNIVDGVFQSGKSWIMTELALNLSYSLRQKVLVLSASRKSSDIHADSLQLVQSSITDLTKRSRVSISRYGPGDHQLSPQVIAKTIRKAKHGDDAMELAEYEKKICDANIICTTMDKDGINSFYTHASKRRDIKKFDVCIVDDADQMPEYWQYLPFLCGIHKIILFGNSKNTSNHHAESLFSRMLKDIPKNSAHQLREPFYKRAK